MDKDMEMRKCAKAALVVGALAVNALFGLYNLSVTERVKTLSKPQKGAILLLNTLNTGNGLAHLMVNVLMGAYGKEME